MLRLVMPQAVTIVVDVVAWGVFHAATGYAAHRLGDERLSRDGWGLRERTFEDRGRWYRRRLRIHRWKDRLPEAGAVFEGGVSKRELPAPDETLIDPLDYEQQARLSFAEPLAFNNDRQPCKHPGHHHF